MNSNCRAIEYTISDCIPIITIDFSLARLTSRTDKSTEISSVNVITLYIYKKEALRE